MTRINLLHKVFSLLSVLLIGLLSPLTQADFLDQFQSDFRFQKLAFGNKLSNIAINDVVQDKSGFVWVATSDGLNRFDGYSSKIYRPSIQSTHSISHFNITSLLVDNHGVLWVGTKNGLNRYNEKLDQFSVISPNDKNNDDFESLYIQDLYQDSKGHIWVASNNGVVFRVKTNEKELHPVYFDKKNLTDSTIYVRDFIETDDHKLLIASSIGILQYDEESNLVIRLALTNDDQNISTKNYTHFFLINNSDLLIGTTMGLYALNLETGKSEELLSEAFRSKWITAITPLDHQELLIGTLDSGLFLVNLNKQSYRHFESSTQKYDLLSNQITTIFESRDKNVWIGTNLGINLIDLQTQKFLHIQTQKISSNCLSGDTIYAILKDSRDTLWVAPFGYGLNKIDLKNNHCEKITKLDNSPIKGILDNIVSFYEDETGEIWIGTYDSGIVRYNPHENKFKYFDVNQFSENHVFMTDIKSIVGDKNGTVWIATQTSGFFGFDINEQILKQYYPHLKTTPNIKVEAINDIETDFSGNIWLATSFDGLWLFDPIKQEFTFQKTDIEGNKIFPKSLMSLNLDSKNNLWIGTKGNGVIKYDLKSKTTQTYTTENGLENNIVMNALQDNNGNMWFMTDRGLSALSLKKGNIRTYLEKDGLQADAFTPTGFFDKKNNQIWTGGISGFNRFNPDTILVASNNLQPILTTIELFYQPLGLSVDSPNSPLETVLHKTKQLHLSHEQNVISFSFSALEFVSPESIKYRFKLDGYDSKWNTVNSERRHANYTNLAPGSYTFRVKASNKFGDWSNLETAIRIDIAFPWWQTNIAYVIYIILFFALFYLIVTLRTKNLVKRSLILEKSVTQRTEELATEKQKVEQLLSRKNEEFANVSHEFRTPLTLILGPIAQLLNNNHSEQDINKLNIVQRNGYRLLRMVDQLLNLETFRIKSLTQKIPQASGKTVKLLAEAFGDLAKAKNINLQSKNIAEVNFEFTPDALEKIVVNLLSNAIKYTNSGGKITIETQRTSNNQLVIQVTDTGIGIPADKLDSVFERYSRVLDENSELVTGAGIGLSLVKSLVEAHQGQISIHSELGVGTTITVCLPIIGEVDSHQVSQHSNNEIIAMELMSITSQTSKTSQESQQLSPDSEINKPSVLVIEDNQDMRDYITENIKGDYRVLTAKDGEQGVEIAIAEIPDLIISDVMMPKMDGYEVTHQLRQNQLTNHIPIVLLTARGDRESRLKGWFEKADEYLTKPFDTEELKIRLNSLLEIRDILKKRFAENAFQVNDTSNDEKKPSTDNQQPSRNKQQQAFITKLNGQLESLYIEPTTAVAQIASILAMSERQLYRKLKSIMDMTPGEYLRRYRLEKAKTLLEDGESVSFAAFEVGFSTQSNFSKCFKAQFGFSPREIKR